MYRLIAILLCVSSAISAEPRTPADELKTVKPLPGYKVELAASEPNVIDPVAVAFDERGRMFVCEMRGYPNAGVATGRENRGRIRLLTDEDGDGVFEKSAVFADGLRFPTGVLPWKNGVIVTVAPDVLYLEDTNGDGRADKTTVLYTGFGLDNIQQIINTPRWGMDGWVYCTVGSTGGSILSPGHPDMKPVVLRGRGIRFKLDDLKSLEPTSGGGQYGLTCDEAQHWFVNTNSAHLRQIVLPDDALRRNPYLAVPTVSLDISEHGAACQVFRISPFEAWRVERTTRRKDGPEAKRLPPTELVPGGFITSACSPLYYPLGEPLFPERDRGCVYVCDPANNLITRDKLEANGSVYKGKRIDQGVEFLASTDNWFRPVSLTLGPDGAIYVIDFYREVIETPISLPDDIKAKLNLESRERGRIWRIVPKDYVYKVPKRVGGTGPELVAALGSEHEWVRNTASRLVASARYEGIEAALERATSTNGPGRANLLHALDQRRGLTATALLQALSDPATEVRIVALRLAEPHFARHPKLVAAASKLADDSSGFVRFQLALSAGSMPITDSASVLTKLLQASANDPWLSAAALSSAKEVSPTILADLAARESSSATVRSLAMIAGARGGDEPIANVLRLAVEAKAPAMRVALLDGVGAGMRARDANLGQWLAKHPDEANRLKQVFVRATETIRDPAAKARLEAIRTLSFAPFAFASEPLAELLKPQAAPELQSAALSALAGFDDPKVPELLLEGWAGYGPTLRREALEAMFARPDRLNKLLDAIEKKIVPAAHVDADRAESLRKHANPAVRTRATKLLVAQVAADRKKVIDDYRSALELKGDVVRGRDLFRKNCTACHRLEDNGYEVGAILTAALRNKTRDALLIDILDPSREVDSRYVNYTLTTLAGRSVSGLLAVETPTSITLRRGEKAEDTILRTQIDELRATGKSLMPDEFEKLLNRQQMADLIEYLLTVR